MQVSKSGGGTFEQAPKGTYQAVCVDVADEGMHPNTFKDGSPLERKISIAFQLNKPREDGKPFLISRWFTFSLHEKASLSKFLCDWHDASYAELPNDFELEELVARNARIRVIQEPKKSKPDEMRAIITSIEPWEGAELMEPQDYVRKHLRDIEGYNGGTHSEASESVSPSANKFRPNAPVQAARFVPDADEAPRRSLVPEAMNGRLRAQASQKERVKELAGMTAPDDDEPNPFADE